MCRSPSFASVMSRIGQTTKKAFHVACMSGFPWGFEPVDNDAGPSLVRRRARHALFERWPKFARPMAAAAMLLLWPVHSCLDAFFCTRIVRRLKLSLRSSASLFLELWILALRKHVQPREAFAYYLLEKDRVDADRWWYGAELRSLALATTDSEAAGMASDKNAFADWCEANGLRSIPTLAVIAGSSSSHIALPARDLLLKPQFGSRGNGVEAWRYQEGRYHQLYSNVTLSDDEFAQHAARHAKQYGQTLVQPLLSPHSAIEPIARDGMPTVRAITARWPNGKVEIGPALLQAPRPSAAISHSGPFRLINSQHGTLLPIASVLFTLLRDTSLDAEF